MGSEGVEKRGQGSMATFKLVCNPEYFFLLFAVALTLANIRDTDNMILLLDPRIALQNAFLLFLEEKDLRGWPTVLICPGLKEVPGLLRDC